MNSPENHPEQNQSIGLETALQVHNLLNELIPEDSKHPSVWIGNQATDLKHGKVFPETSCEFNLTATFIDPTVGYIDFECENACIREKPGITGLHGEEKVVIQSKEWSMYFREVGFLSPHHGYDDEGQFYFKIKEVHGHECDGNCEHG